MKINIYGSVCGNTGFAIHTLNLAKALNKIADVALEVPYFPNWERQVDGETLAMIRKDNTKEITIGIVQPPQMELKYSQRPKLSIPFVVFEGDRIPKWWRILLEKYELIFVPSSHTEQACINSGVESGKIKIVPHGVDSSIFRPSEPIPELKSDKYTFLFVGGWAQGENDRKDLALLFRAFCSEFKKENVRLLVKIHSVYNRPDWNLDKEMDRLNLPKDRLEIVISTVHLEDKMLARLYSTADCFVCPSRAEGFGMTFAEAMACGLPVIAGGYGGQIDFVNESHGFLLKDFELAPSKDRDIIYEGVNWANYKEGELRKYMRYAFEHQEEMKEKGRKAMEDIQSWSWKNSARIALKHIEEFYGTKDT